MTLFFQFEADFVTSLRCIPMQVRYKLDTCGVKLKLTHWHQLSTPQRQALVSLPCETATEISAYRHQLRQWVQAQTGEFPKDLALPDPDPWGITTELPDSVQAEAEAVGHPLSLGQWQALSSLQRFALIKLSRSGHENRNFLPALVEFGLAQP